VKVTHQLVIERSREHVWKAFDDPDNMKRWQPTLMAFDHQRGVRGQPGAVSLLTYQENGKSIVMTETITVRREPEEFSGTYDNAMALNTVRNTFATQGPEHTRWTVESEFVFKGLIFRLLSPLVRGLLDRRIRTDMERFKALVEQETA
jgi:uncharacterized protein YndB with AHSA1/START domain